MKAKFKTYLLYISGFLLVFSAVFYITEWKFIPYVYAVASVIMAVLFLTNPYQGDNFRLKRLNIQQAIAALLWPVSAFLMLKGMNEWMVCLFISAVLLSYVGIIHNHEIKKKNKKE
ncbi:MAG: hypothetical protein LBH32_15105 [Dysgonamonadaceae bacterium]|nr:hypothetical protein [Dysgonamonadaceae bacterium]